MDFKWLALLSFVVHLWPKLNVKHKPVTDWLEMLPHSIYGVNTVKLEMFAND